MKPRIKIAVKPVGKPVRVEEICNRLDSLRGIVDGYIEVFRITEDLAIVCNEEGRVNGMEFNCRAFGQDFYGDIFVVGIDGEDFTDVTDVKIIKLLLED